MSGWSSLPWSWRAFQKDLVGFQSLSLMRTALSVETKTHSFFEGLVISYPNSTNPKLLSSCPISLAWSREGPMALPFNLPYFLHCSLHQLAACSSSRVNTRGSDAEGAAQLWTPVCAVCNSPLSTKLSVWGDSHILIHSRGAFVGSLEVPHGTSPAQFPNVFEKPLNWPFVNPPTTHTPPASS